MSLLQQELLLGRDSSGFLSFCDFQRIALYHPEEGYYMRSRSPFGRTGDFYTAPAVHPVFGEMVARYIQQRFADWEADSESMPIFHIVEFGAGDGRLSESILNTFSDHWPVHYQKLVYWIIEISPRSRLEQQQRLSIHQNVRWSDSLPQLEQAVIVSNEFVDAMPVFLVQRMGKNDWKEVGVRWNGSRWVKASRSISNNRLLHYVSTYGKQLPISNWMEVNLAAIDWLQLIQQQVGKGCLITFDYGALADELYPEYMNEGTIRGYREHQVQSDIFLDPGEMDLTHDVNFSALIDTGIAQEWHTVQFVGQSEFLVQAGLLESFQSGTADEKLRGAIKHLLLGFSPKFHVLVQGW